MTFVHKDLMNESMHFSFTVHVLVHRSHHCP